MRGIVTFSVVIHHLFISPGHNFFGRHGQPAGTHGVSDPAEVICRAGRGIEGDRFFGYRPDYHGQITFFDWDVLLGTRREFSVPALSPSVFRRNVLLEGVALNDLIGRRFTVGAVEFEGMGESKPCHWMNDVVAPGAEAWLRGRGGLRAKILSDGSLRRGPAQLEMGAAIGQTGLLEEIVAGAGARGGSVERRAG